MTVSAILLAGGESKRMGRDKALVPLAGLPMILWTARAIAGVAGVMELVVAGGDVARSKLYGETLRGRLGIPLQTVADPRRDAGPIAGIEAGARASTGQMVAIAPVDAPLIVPEVYNLLVDECGTHGGAVPEIDGELEPLNAIYKRDVLLRAIQESHLTAPRELVEATRAKRVADFKIKEIDSELLTFADADTPDDLAELEDLIATRGGGATRTGNHGLSSQT